MSKLIPLIEHGGKALTVMGFEVCQNRLAFPTWDYAMAHYPPQRVIELGTCNGGFTICMGLMCWAKQITLHSYEIGPLAVSQRNRELAAHLAINLHTMNVFSPEAQEMIANLIRADGVVYVLCDNGDKVREFNTYAQYLKPGDVIAAHDYSCGAEAEFWWPWREITQEQVAESVSKFNLQLFNQEYFDMAGWLVYKKA